MIYSYQGHSTDENDVSVVGPRVSSFSPINKSGVFCCRMSGHNIRSA